MLTMYRRYHPVYIFSLAIVVILAACGGADNGGEIPSGPSFRIITSTPRATNTPTITPTPVVPVLSTDELAGEQIDMWYFWDPVMPDALAQAVDRFNADNEYGIEVSLRAFLHPVDLEEAVPEAIASGNPPDVVLAEPYQYLPWHDAGVVVDLSPYVDSASYGLDLDSFYPALIGRDLYADGRLGFPGLFSAQMLLYNLSWAQELGYDRPPDTPKAFTERACAAHLANGDRTGGWMIDPSPGGAVAWLLAFDPLMRQRIDFKSEGVEVGYTFLVELSQQGCAWAPTARYPDEAFVDRLGLFYAVNTREIGYVDVAFGAAGSEDDWVAIGYPNPEGEPMISLSGRSYVVLQGDVETQVAAWLLVRYLAGEEVQQVMAENGLYLPLDTDTADVLSGDSSLPIVWRESFDLLDNAVAEPPVRVWGVLRSVLQDAQAEVTDERFALGTLSLFLHQLDELYKDLQSRQE